ncbi:RNI-like protein [Fomitiporia mediterranea MF3/22]|uniref:RNI-like protein n=1 Tax=Fomitiporia mediterranea (strain MF3/22) TaxID=694068 RepID=UPI00044087C7|nr:RNI-like protein [Fomitiporia mediterranea MF3/22]EJD03750.1 RNI-like protein [Fomitiporia mediterranea MF3/22]
MSCGRVIDGDEPLFDFDAIEGLEGNDPATLDTCMSAHTMPAELFDMSFIPQLAHLDLSSFSAASTPAEVVDFIFRAQEPDSYEYFEDSGDLCAFKDKGKAVSRPVDIVPRDSSMTPRFDLFSFNGGTSGPSKQSRRSLRASSSVSPPQSPDYFAFSPMSDVRQGSAAASYATDITTPGSSFPDAQQLKSDLSHESEDVGKGKSRAEPPSLPPLLFSPTEFSRGETNWPIEIGHSPVNAVSSSSHASPTVVDFPASPTPPLGSGASTPIYKCASRHRSFPSLTTDSPRRFATRQPRRSKLSLISGKRPSNLARKLLSRNDVFEPEYIVPSNTPIQETERILYSSLSAPSTPCISRSFAISDAYAISALRVGGSSPSLFECMLPKEIKLEVFHTLLRLHEVDGETLQKSSGWTALKASQKEHRWIGKEKGIVELIRLSRVSKSWQSLVFDGQLWHDLNLKAFPNIPIHMLRHLAVSSGSFIRTVDLTGHTQLTAASFLELTNSFCISNTLPGETMSVTQLTSINLSGCSGITTRVLHDLITRSPLLDKVNVRGLSAVTNETCKLLGTHCPVLSSIDLSRCHGMDAYGVLSFFAPHSEYRTVLMLRRLRLAGLKRAGDRLLSVLGRYAPNLEILDLSGARELHNTAIEAFVTCAEDGDSSQEVLLTSREAGRDPGDPTKYRRRVTKLRHLSLSYCPLLTDHACSHLAYAVPQLEFLELAGVGAELKDDGLVRLLNTTPLIRRLDLDEACELTDATLAVLTPRIFEEEPTNVQRLAPGSQLEVLNLSYAVQLSNDAILALVRNCTRLVHIELDSTRVSGNSVKEFVRLSRKREAVDAEIVVVDCRHVGDSAVKELHGTTRTRKGWRAWEAQHLHYLDARDDEGLGVGTDECDEKRVALKSFYQWQTVDAVEAAREKRRKSKKNGRGEEEVAFTRRSSSKWWSPGSRRGSGSASPVTWTGDREREGCIIM